LVSCWSVKDVVSIVIYQRLVYKAEVFKTSAFNHSATSPHPDHILFHPHAPQPHSVAGGGRVDSGIGQTRGGCPMATTLSPRDYIPEAVAPLRVDPPGTVLTMPAPNKIHHIHIFADQHYDEVVAFYMTLLNAQLVRERANSNTFLTYDDYDHRIAIFKREGWSERADKTLGVSHVAFCYESLGELMFIYKKMKVLGHIPHRALNHGNSTSFDYRDPDGNEVEIMMDNYLPLDNQAYKRHYQGTKEFGKGADGDFDPDKMLALYESGVPDDILLDREEVKRLSSEGKL
jgi:hypothetical protein